MNFKQESAEALALQALGWLAGNADLLPVFLANSGASAGDLAAGARQPAFLAAVLDFLLMDDATVIAFCDDIGQSYDAPRLARAFLPGGQDIHWT